MAFLVPPSGPGSIEAARAQVVRRHPSASPCETARAALGLCFGGRPSEEIEAIVAGGPDLAALEEETYRLNLVRLRRACGGGLPRVASLQFPFEYDGQIASIARALGARPGMDAVHLVVSGYLETRTEVRLAESVALSALPVPRPELLADFAALDLVFLNETFACPWIGPHPIRVGLPHASLNPPEISVARYGAGAWFDVLMAAQPWPHLAPDAFVDLYPREMVEHGRDALRIAVAGSPRFDDLHRACQAFPAPRRKIVYHLSLEQPWVYANLRTIVQALLDGLPGHEILLRPHPVERGRADLLEQLSVFRGHHRFSVSGSASYADDYADAQAALVHAPDPIRNLPLASLRPLVHFDPTAPAPEAIPLGWRAPDLGTAIAILAGIDQDPDADRARLAAERDRRMPNPGRSVDHVLDHIDDLRVGRPVAGWTTHPLWSRGEAPSVARQYRRGLERAREIGQPCLALVRRACERFPDEPAFLLERAKLESEPAGEGLLYDRWFWTTGLESAARAWTLLRDRPAGDPLAAEAREWILSIGLRHALAWCWKEARGATSGDAARTLSTLLSCDPEGWIARSWPNAEAALARCGELERTCARVSGEAGSAFATLGAERLALRRDDLAREALEKAVEFAPEHADALFNLMLLDRMQNRRGDALIRAQKLFALLPGDPELAEHIRELSV